ncbi:hypothetical protein [Halorarum salinum]|uniref:Uncharacterized protein n=1 Tax=Halorarum salinum TaxID=2743089 RepID=A0A7D5Q9W9_9EURY|nr:hypothetical protein [Halobaculum salinum]QLG60400.1 hypothetical protein HUG12_00985 [Halobaculum salinum]
MIADIARNGYDTEPERTAVGRPIGGTTEVTGSRRGRPALPLSTTRRGVEGT